MTIRRQLNIHLWHTYFKVNKTERNENKEIKTWTDLMEAIDEYFKQTYAEDREKSIEVLEFEAEYGDE